MSTVGRFLFGDGSSDFTIRAPSSGGNIFSLGLSAVTMWSDQKVSAGGSGGTQYTDLLKFDGVTAQTTVTTRADGSTGGFYGPVGVTVMWADAGGSERVKVFADPSAAYVPQSLLGAAAGTSGGAVLINNPAINSAAADISSGAITGPGITNFNNVLGGDGWATVETTVQSSGKVPNVPVLGTAAAVSDLSGYDEVSGGIASHIAGMHCFTGINTTHCSCLWGSMQAIVSGRLDPSCVVTNASATVLDPAILASDVGSRVHSQYVIPGTTITSVTPGVSFVMSNPWLGTSSVGTPGQVTTATTGIAIITQRTGVGFTTGSTTVTDTSAIAGDAGKRITPLGATGWPGGITIVSVTPGTGYTISQACPASVATGSYTCVIGPSTDYSATGGTRTSVVGAVASGAFGTDVLVGGSNSLAWGAGIVSTGIESFTAGLNIINLANTSHAVGRSHFLSAAAKNSVAQGEGCSISQEGVVAYADGFEAVLGDRQLSRMLIRTDTTDATTTILGTVGAAANPQMPANSTWSYTADITARRTDAALDDRWVIKGIVRRTGTGAPAAVGSPSIEHYNPASGWTLTVAPTGSASLSTQGTGAVGEAVSWFGFIDVTQVIG